MASPVSFERVSKTYPNGYEAVRDFSLRIGAGELMVLVGPSGSGKSTVLRLLAGLEEISAGTLRIEDQVANTWSPQARNVAMVFQDYALYPNMTVQGNLEFPLKMRKLKGAEIKRRVGWAAELLSLGEVLSRLPGQLSGGQRQRVAMGRALVREPSVFLLDEPLSNLDPKLRGQVRREIGGLQRRTGTTMVYVTHDQMEAMTLGRRIAVLNGGRIQQVADPKTLYDLPANAFVAGFIGIPPMNIFPAELVPAADGRLQVMVDGQILALVPDRCAGPGRPRTVCAGIRPEALCLVEDYQPGFPATVESTEYLGHETLVRIRPGLPGFSVGVGLTWTARLPGLVVAETNQVLRFKVKAEQIYLFP